jgi:cytochrome c551/c552
MARSRSILAAGVAALLAVGAQAEEPGGGSALTEETVWAFVKQNRLDCKACHDISTKIVGPAWRDVGVKYKGQKVRAQLIEKVKKGGKGVWGEVPMVPHPNVSDETIGRLIDFELSLGNEARLVKQP